MKIIKKEAGLNPKNYVGKKFTAEIFDIIENEKIGKNGAYKDYTLKVIGSTGDLIGDFNINFLFSRDFNALIDTFGEETEQWKGKLIDLEGTQEGAYFRWILTPTEVVS